MKKMLLAVVICVLLSPVFSFAKQDAWLIQDVRKSERACTCQQDDITLTIQDLMSMHGSGIFVCIPQDQIADIRKRFEVSDLGGLVGKIVTRKDAKFSQTMEELVRDLVESREVLSRTNPEMY